MTVVAIRCEACADFGAIVDWTMARGEAGRWMSGISGWHTCPVCNGTGTETPPQDHDKDARHAIEGGSDD